MLTTPSQDSKESPATQAYWVHPERTGGQVRVESSETRVQMEEEGHLAGRVHLERWEIQD